MTTMKSNIYYEQLYKLDPLERDLYRSLQSFMDNTTYKCFPSIQTLSLMLKRCRATTKKYLKMLQRKNIITIRERKVRHGVTNNKYNETNEYTLMLEKSNGKVKIDDSDNNKSNPLILKETDLMGIVRELEADHNKESVSSALKTMRRNMRNGSIVNNMKNYLKFLINTSCNQLEQVNKAIESSNKPSSSTSSTKKSKESKNYRSKDNKVETKFHNFKQRTDRYTPEELEKMVLRKNKHK